MRLSLHAVSVLVCAAALCAAQAPGLPDLPPARKSSAPAQPAPAVQGTGCMKPYVIGPLDVLYVRVWNNQNLTGPVNVGSDGLISLALIGSVRADGLTLAQLTDLLSTKLKDFYNNDPEVTIEVTRYNSKKYYIMGQGAYHPGEFPLTRCTKVSEAISIAGGYKEFANPKKIYVLRDKQKFPFNYKDVLAGKHLDQDITLENGDKIVIPE